MEQENKSNEQVNSLLMVNGLDYRFPPTLSVAVSRSHSAYAANQQIYPEGSTLNCTLSSGAQYVNFRESYLTFTVEVEGLLEGKDEYRFPSSQVEDANAPADFQPGRNGVLNCFESFRWVHSSGTMLEEFNQDMALWSYVRDRYTWSSDQSRSIGSMMDYGMQNKNVHTFKYDAANAINSVSKKTYIVPLSCLSDAMNQQQLAPSFLVAGSRFELRLNSLTRAFTKVTPNATINNASIKYSITNASVVLQQIQLTDSIVRALSNISASSGLEYPFTSIAVNSLTTDSESATIQVSRSLSRANCVIVVRRRVDQLDSTTVAPNYQSQCPSDLGILEYSVQLGGQTIPLSPITSQGEAFWHALVTFGATYDRGACIPVSLQNFTGDATARVSDGIYAVSLETSSTLNQSGSALSSQRVLVFNFRATTVASRYTMFTPHVRLITAFLDSAIVRS
jgi:hypothetical protein